MTIELFIAFVSSSAVIVFSPGPTVLLVVHNALQYGNWSAKYLIPATILGDITAITLSFVGVGTILTTFPQGLHILKFIGGVYIIIIGITSIFSSSNIQKENLPTQKLPGRIIFTHIFLITAFNPKTIVFLLAFFPVFINPEESTIKQMLIMGVVFMSLGLISVTTYFLAATKISTWLKRTSSIRIVHIVTSIMLCIIGTITIFI